jgi:hypothetical protein
MAVVKLISIEFAKKALRIAEYDGDGNLIDQEDDDLVQAYIDATTEAVLRYLRGGEEGWTEETAPKAVKTAIVLGVQSLYQTDQAELLSGLGSSDPKNPLVALLCMLRKPTLA